jgi:hypothetical protein
VILTTEQGDSLPLKAGSEALSTNGDRSAVQCADTNAVEMLFGRELAWRLNRLLHSPDGAAKALLDLMNLSIG